MYSLVLQSFGNEREYRRALFCIFSHSAFADESCEKVILFTDNSEYFKMYLGDIPVQYVLLTPEKITTMRGSIDFLHRMKIALIEDAFSLTSGNLLYVDSDTYFINSPSALMNTISPNVSGMHIHEYQFKILKDMPLPAGETFQAFYTLISSKEFLLTDGSRTKISDEESSWNAGAIAFHHSHQNLFQDVYQLTEQFYPLTSNHASEQYAFSILLQRNTKIIALDKIIYHYWYRIKKNIVDDILAKELATTIQSKADRLGKIKTFALSLDSIIDRHLWILKDKSIQSFNENQFIEGYQFALRALIKNPFDRKFLKDLGYHTRRLFKNFFK